MVGNLRAEHRCRSHEMVLRRLPSKLKMMFRLENFDPYNCENFRLNRKFREFAKFPVQPEISSTWQYWIRPKPHGPESYSRDAGTQNESEIGQKLSTYSICARYKNALFHSYIANDFGHYFRDLAGTRNQDITSVSYTHLTLPTNSRV